MKTTVKCDCQYKSNCKHVEKLQSATYQMKNENPSLKEFNEIVIVQSDEPYSHYKRWQNPRSGDRDSFEISCPALKRLSFDELKKLLIEQKTDNPGINNNDGSEKEDERAGEYEEDASEEDADSNADNLTRAINRLESVSKIRYPIEIVDSEEINAYALPGGKIQITSAAAKNLSEAELAFLIAHEEAHIDRHHSLKKNVFASFCKAGIKQIAKAKQLGGLKKIVSMIAAETAAIAALPLIDKGHELGADLVAKRRMTEAGYSEEDAAKFFDRVEEYRGKYFSAHPTPQFRKKFLEE